MVFSLSSRILPELEFSKMELFREPSRSRLVHGLFSRSEVDLQPYPSSVSRPSGVCGEMVLIPAAFERFEASHRLPPSGGDATGTWPAFCRHAFHFRKPLPERRSPTGQQYTRFAILHRDPGQVPFASPPGHLSSFSPPCKPGKSRKRLNTQKIHAVIYSAFVDSTLLAASFSVVTWLRAAAATCAHHPVGRRQKNVLRTAPD